ncbi:MAG: SH3 domain-containing protein [Spirochaetaceae bacterium]|jgi:hypothetical protein|nr:SH3 domain-containing protein [Spirochaetaceae bacterium]
MNFFKQLFSLKVENVPAVPTPPENNDIVLAENSKYRLTRQMYLFPGQEVSASVNDYLLIGATVVYLKSGEIIEDNHILSPWVYVRSAKGKEGWCFSHYLQKIE